MGGRGPLMAPEHDTVPQQNPSMKGFHKLHGYACGYGYALPAYGVRRTQTIQTKMNARVTLTEWIAEDILYETD